MASVFISHSSSDDVFVERLAQRLSVAGVSIWLDSGRIIPGDDIIEKIEQGLFDATHVVVVLSPSSILSNWVREESHAAQLAAIAGTSRIVPVIYGAMSPSSVPPLLRSRLYVDFRNPNDFERSVAQLLSAFADQPEARQHPSLVRLVDLQIARRMNSGEAAVEVLLTNTGKRTVGIKSLSINSCVPYRVAYAMPPPIVVYPLSLTIGPRTANGIAVVGGAIGHEAEEWRRPVAGRLVLGPYHTELIVRLPLFVAVGPSEETLVRVPIEAISSREEPLESERRAASLPKSFYGEGFEWGTRVTIEQTDGVTASQVFPHSLLDTLAPLFSGVGTVEVRRRVGRDF